MSISRNEFEEAKEDIENQILGFLKRLELKGREGNFDVLAENEETQPLIGQIVLERLDLIIEPSTRRLIPNPRSPEMPMIEIFMAMAYNNMRFAYAHPNPYGLRIPAKRYAKCFLIPILIST